MKKFSFLPIACILAGIVGLAFAQTPVPTVKAGVKYPVAINVNMRMMQQMQAISKAFHSGKITKEQAKAQRDQLRTIRKQQLDFMKLNGKKDLTTDQVNQINQALDALPK